MSSRENDYGISWVNSAVCASANPTKFGVTESGDGLSIQATETCLYTVLFCAVIR